MSWAEDEGIDAYKLTESSDSRDYEWEDRTRNIQLISDLETSHITNIIRGLEQGKWYYGQSHKLNYLKRELEKRI